MSSDTNNPLCFESMTAEIKELHDKYFDPYDPIGLADIQNYLKREQKFMAQEGYSKNPKYKRLRQVALHVISDTIMISGKVDACVPYLAIIYFDCCLSRRGLTKYKDITIMEDMELLAVSSLWFAFETTLSLSYDFWDESNKSDKIRDYMIKRPRNVKCLNASYDYTYMADMRPEKPVTSLCFINYFLNECKPRREVAEEKETITQMILETQDDIRFCDYKPSIIAASAVTSFLSNEAPEYSHTYQEKIMGLRCIDKNQLKDCLALLEETWVGQIESLSLQDGGKGFNVTIDYVPQWMTAPDIIYLYDIYFDPYDPRGFEDIDRYLEYEGKHIPDDGYSTDLNNERMRQVALNAIIQSIRIGGEVNAFVPYLAMNYYDRYISRRGILNKQATMREEIEMLAICCFALAFETTLTYGYPKIGDICYEKTRQFLSKRPRNINYFLDSSAKDEISRSIQTKEPITSLCFINHLLNVCSPEHEVPGGKEAITQIILETQDDIRFTAYKPSILSGSAVAAFLSCQSPDYSHTYEENILKHVALFRRNEFKDCLSLVKEKCDTKKLIEMKRLSVQDGGIGSHVNIDYQLQWIITDEIEGILKTLGAGTRVSVQLANIDHEMRSRADEIQIFLSEIENLENVDDMTVEQLSGMLTELGNLYLKMQYVIVKMIGYVETPQ